MRLKTHTVDVICGIGLLAVLFGGVLAVIASGTATARAVSRQNERVTQRMEELKQAQSVLERLDRALRNNEAALDQLQKRLPESQAMGAFLADLDILMRNSGIDLSNVTPGAPVREALCSRMPLRFSCRGSFEGLHRALYGLETQERIVRVDQVVVKMDEQSGDCSMDVSCRIYGR